MLNICLFKMKDEYQIDMTDDNLSSLASALTNMNYFYDDKLLKTNKIFCLDYSVVFKQTRGVIKNLFCQLHLQNWWNSFDVYKTKIY